MRDVKEEGGILSDLCKMERIATLKVKLLHEEGGVR